MSNFIKTVISEETKKNRSQKTIQIYHQNKTKITRKQLLKLEEQIKGNLKPGETFMIKGLLDKWYTLKGFQQDGLDFNDEEEYWENKSYSSSNYYDGFFQLMITIGKNIG